MSLVPVRNRKPGPTVFTDFATQTVTNWEGAGDPAGGDVQLVPDAYLSMPNFQRSMTKGVFEVMDSADGAEAVNRADGAFASRQAAEDAAVLESIKRESTNDMLSLECVGPSPRGTGDCGTPVPVYANKRMDAPPLCGLHESLAHEYAPIEGEVGADGRPTITWIHAVVSPTQRQL